MYLTIASDLHLEFSKIDIQLFIPTIKHNPHILILAGDIIVKNTKLFLQFKDLIKELESYYTKIIYIPGNHDFYHANYDETIFNTLTTNQFIYLNNHSFEYNDIVFIGSTLWTDFNKEDPLTLEKSNSLLNDYHIIKHKDKKISSYFILNKHREALTFITNTLEQYHKKKCIVITHHAPSFFSIPEEYKHYYIMNGNFYSDLYHLIEKSPQIAYWIHGHIHNPCSYLINKTKILCNPRGYPHEAVYSTFKPLTIKV